MTDSTCLVESRDRYDNHAILLPMFGNGLDMEGEFAGTLAFLSSQWECCPIQVGSGMSTMVVSVPGSKGTSVASIS